MTERARARHTAGMLRRSRPLGLLVAATLFGCAEDTTPLGLFDARTGDAGALDASSPPDGGAGPRTVAGYDDPALSGHGFIRARDL